MRALWTALWLLTCCPAAFAEDDDAPPAEAAENNERAPVRWPGLQIGGEVLLPNQWSLRPAGKQVPLGDFPVNVAVHPSGPWAAVLHAGYGDHEIVVVDLTRDRVVSRVLLDQTFYGLCFDAAGERLFASGAEQGLVHAFRFEDGYLSGRKELRLAEEGARCVPAGMTYRAADDALYVADGWGDAVHSVPLGEGKPRRVELQKESYPYAVLADSHSGRLFVSLWGAAAVAVVDAESLRVDALWPTERHPTEMALSPAGERLFVACANSNTISVIDTATGAATEVIASALYPGAPPGSTPNSLALSADGRVLLIANADNNNLALFDVRESGGSRSLGFIPVGWYPTSVRFDAMGRILVANGKGLQSKANRHGPNPLTDPPPTIEEYIGGLFDGTLGVIDPPGPAEMAAYSQDAYAASPLRSDRAPVAAPREEDNPIPAKVGGESPIRHCIYIIKENRTYDQVFGDLPSGNGDETLCIFPERVTPNHHALARQFVLLDNFYVESEVSADGHEWSMAAYATDFVEKTWPLVYRGGSRILTYPSEGSLEIATPAGGYIWDRCLEAGVTYRSYGEFVDNGPTPDDPGTATVEALEGHFDPFFRSFDMDYPDAKRADRFLDELARFEREGEMPRFIVLRLPNDHTVGQSVGKPTPTAMVADNDLALGRVVEAVSRSSFWPIPKALWMIPFECKRETSLALSMMLSMKIK